jgi:hypothetical protein
VSNPQAIAAVTATLQQLMLAEFSEGGVTVTTQAPDRARSNQNGRQLNIFLYHMELNGAWRNGVPRQGEARSTGHPYLGLNLYYMLTAYGQADDDLTGHHVLGRAMRRLYDHPLLGRQEIKDALQGNDLGDQLERVRLTPQPLTLEEMSKIWTAFQTNYRVSAAYEAAVVLIDSALPARTPMPVLRRGKDDHGVFVHAGLEPPFPTITSLEIPSDLPIALIGDTIAFTGHHFGGAGPKVVFRHRWLADPIVIDPVSASDTKASAVLDPARPWLAGVYTVSLRVQRPDDDYVRESNAATLTVSPRITVPQNAQIVGGKVTIMVTVDPKVGAEQSATLLLGSREISTPTRSADGKQLTFVVNDAVEGAFFARLRVDGIDSLLIKDRQKKPPELDPNAKVSLAP